MSKGSRRLKNNKGNLSYLSHGQHGQEVGWVARGLGRELVFIESELSEGRWALCLLYLIGERGGSG